MPIFELDEGRPRLVQPMQPLPGSFGQDCAALLTHHLAAVAGEPLFVVRPRASAGERADLPELLALDSTGRPVIVEVVQVVDDDAVVTALRHAGTAARMTTTDLARAYHPDPSRFPVDFAAFREQVAFGATTSRREGVRLILLCSEVAAEAGDTLAFLRGPGRHVDVLQLGVVRGVDDSRMLDVSPLATHETVRRSVEPTALRLVRSSEAFATAMAYDSGRVNVSRPPMPGAAAGPTQRVSSPDAITPVTGLRVGGSRPPAAPLPPAPHQQVPHAPVPHAPAPLPPTVAAPAARVPAVPPVPAPARPASGVASPADGYPTAPANGHDTAPTNTHVGPPQPPVSAAFVPTSSFAPVAPHLPAVSGGPRPLTPAAGAVLTPSAAALLSPSPAAPPAQPAPAQAQPEPQPVAAQPEPVPARAPEAEADAASGAPQVDSGVPLPELTTLAKRRHAITTLVWFRARRNQRLVAMLRHDGLIELPDGRTFADPDLAAAAAADSLARVDGWRSWRMGDGGPTLAEAAGVPTA